MKIAEWPDETVKDARIVEVLRTVHALEVAGEAIFALMLETGGPLTPEQRRKVEACRLLEVDMAHLVAHHLVMERGVSTGDPSSLQISAASRTAIRADSWRARMVALQTAEATLLPPFRELKVLYADQQPILCNTLLAHALMLRDFAHDEAEGQADHTLSRLVCLLSDESRRALSRFQA